MTFARNAHYITTSMGIFRCIRITLRRLVNCVNIITSLETDTDKVYRYVYTLNLRVEKKRKITIYLLCQIKIVNDLLIQLSLSQPDAFEHIKQTKHDIVFIQRSPGMGKTTFIITFLQISSHLNHSWIACVPSNLDSLNDVQMMVWVGPAFHA